MTKEAANTLHKEARVSHILPCKRHMGRMACIFRLLDGRLNPGGINLVRFEAVSRRIKGEGSQLVIP